MADRPSEEERRRWVEAAPTWARPGRRRDVRRLRARKRRRRERRGRRRSPI